MFTYMIRSKYPENSLTEANDSTRVGDLVKTEYVTLHREGKKWTVYKDIINETVKDQTQRMKRYLIVGPEGHSVKVNAGTPFGKVVQFVKNAPKPIPRTFWQRLTFRPQRFEAMAT